MIELPSPARLGAAASIIGHTAVVMVGLFFTDAHPFASMPSQAISVDIVAPEEAVPPPKPAEPAAAPKPPDPIDFSALTAPPKPTDSPAPAGQPTPQPKTRTAAAPAARPAPPPAPPPAAAPQAAAPQQATAAQPAATTPQASAPQASAPQTASAQQAAIQPQGTEAAQAPPPSTSSAPGPFTPEPDVTVKYGVMLGLPEAQPSDNTFDAPAYETAKVSVDQIAELRRHLKTCSSLPASIAATDKVRIVLRIALTRGGMLAAEPALIEASASAKGPILMQRAMSALQECQPYTMLPADKYKEWKVLDLSFTPQDFTSG